jgi:putative endonuclease
MARGGWVYIVASRRRGMVYIGVTSHIAARIDQHRRDVGSGYCRRYGIKTLVYAEHHDDIRDAIIREKQLKAWKRAWKDQLIEADNLDWRDLYDTLA